jgi:hypothetical protein
VILNLGVLAGQVFIFGFELGFCGLARASAMRENISAKYGINLDEQDGRT